VQNPAPLHTANNSVHEYFSQGNTHEVRKEFGIRNCSVHCTSRDFVIPQAEPHAIGTAAKAWAARPPLEDLTLDYAPGCNLRE
jgi:hypothetical protein